MPRSSSSAPTVASVVVTCSLLPSWTTVTSWGVRMAMSVGRNGSRRERETETKSDVVYPSWFSASATVCAVVQTLVSLPSTERCSRRPRRSTMRLPSFTCAEGDGATRSWAVSRYPRSVSTAPTLPAVVCTVVAWPSTTRWTALSTEFHTTGAATRPASTAPCRPYFTLRSTERCSSGSPVGALSLWSVGHGTVTDRSAGPTEAPYPVRNWALRPPAHRPATHFGRGHREVTTAEAVGRLQVGAADRPGARTAGVVHLGRDGDLLFPRGQVGPLGVGPATVGQPGPVVELQAAVEAVAGVDVPVATGLAGRDGVPVEAVARGRRRLRRRRPALGADLLDLGPRRTEHDALENLALDPLAVDVDDPVGDLRRALTAGGDQLALALVHRRVVVLHDRVADRLGPRQVLGDDALDPNRQARLEQRVRRRPDAVVAVERDAELAQQLSHVTGGRRDLLGLVVVDHRDLLRRPELDVGGSQRQPLGPRHRDEVRTRVAEGRERLGDGRRRRPDVLRLAVDDQMQQATLLEDDLGAVLDVGMEGRGDDVM